MGNKTKGLKACLMAHGILAALLIVATPLCVWAQKPKKLTAQEIIDQYLQAIGGRDLIQRFSSRAAVGKVVRTGEPAVPLYIASTPRSISIVCQFQQFQFRQFYDGSRSLFHPQFISGTQSPFADQFNKMLASGLMLNGIGLYNLLVNPSPESAFEAAGTAKVSGKPTYVIEVKQKRRRVARLFFDTEKFYWLRTDFGTVRPLEPMGGGTEGQDVPFYVETSDFRTVDGVVLPFSFIESAPRPIAGSFEMRPFGELKATIEEYHHNVSIDPAFFARPE